MEWTHIACMAAGGLLGSFLMTVWQNERRAWNHEWGRVTREAFDGFRMYPPATQPPPPAPPAPPAPRSRPPETR